MTQPEALRLADYLTDRNRLDLTCDEAAAELRRLHESNQELLGLLKRANGCTGSHTVMWQSEACAAIDKAERGAA
jgi:hypothetical protein